MCLIVPICGVLAILKNKKKVWILLHCKSFIVLSEYIHTFFYFEIEKNKMERQKKNNKLDPKENVKFGIRTHDRWFQRPMLSPLRKGSFAINR